MTDQIDCPKCGRPDMRIIRTRQRTDGLLATQYRCRNSNCLCNITELSGKKTGPTRTRTRQLTPDDVLRILTSSEGPVEMAAAIGCHRQTISDVRCGRSYTDFHPEVQRPGSYKKQIEANSCSRCIHWLNRCTMDFPEGEHGSFANLCPCYTTNHSASISDGITRSGCVTRMREIAYV